MTTVRDTDLKEKDEELKNIGWDGISNQNSRWQEEWGREKIGEKY